MVNVLVPHKNVKCRFSDYLLLESVWTGAVFHRPSVTADSPDLWLYTRAGLPPPPAPARVRLRVPASRAPRGGGCGQGPPASLPAPRSRRAAAPAASAGQDDSREPAGFLKITFPPVNSLACQQTVPAAPLRNSGTV